MTTTKYFTCSPCSFRDVYQKASFWCCECEDSLCLPCKKYHSSSKVSKSHKVIPIEQIESVKQIAEEFSETCSEHDRQYDFFCYDHHQAWCVRCSSSLHRNCKQICPIEDVTRDIKSSVAMNNIEENLDALIMNVENIIEEKNVSLNLIDDQVKVMQHNVNEIRKQVHEKCDKLLEQFNNRLYRSKTEEEDIVKDDLEMLKSKLTQIQNIKKKIAQIKANGTRLQILLSLGKYERMISEEENRLLSSIDDGKLDCREPFFIPNEKIIHFTTYESIGEIVQRVRRPKVSVSTSAQASKISKNNLITNTHTFTSEILTQKVNIFNAFSTKSRILLFVGRLLMICGFLFDILLIGCAYIFTDIWWPPHYLFWIIPWAICQLSGCALIFSQRYIKAACGMFLVVIAFETVGISGDKWTYLVNRLDFAVIGGILLLLTEDRNTEKWVLKKLPVLYRNRPNNLQLIRRIILVLMFLTLFQSKFHSFYIISNVVTLSLLICVLIGYKIKLTIFLLISWLLTSYGIFIVGFWNIPSHKPDFQQHPTYSYQYGHTTYSFYSQTVKQIFGSQKLFQTFSVIGGLLMLLVYDINTIKHGVSKKRQ